MDNTVDTLIEVITELTNRGHKVNVDDDFIEGIMLIDEFIEELTFLNTLLNMK